MKEIKRLYVYVTERPDGKARVAAVGDEHNTIPLLSTRAAPIAAMKEVVAVLRADGADVRLYEFACVGPADEAAVVAEGEAESAPETPETPEAPAGAAPLYWAGDTAEA